MKKVSAADRALSLVDLEKNRRKSNAESYL